VTHGNTHRIRDFFGGIDDYGVYEVKEQVKIGSSTFFAPGKYDGDLLRSRLNEIREKIGEVSFLSLLDRLPEVMEKES